MIGLAGAHRTGKTTLAKLFAEEKGIDFVSIPKVLHKLGLEPKDITTIDKRLYVQSHIVEACSNTFLRRSNFFISDRTPMDVAAYTVADLGQDLTYDQQKQALKIVSDCHMITNACFDAILFISPAIPYVAEPGKPLPNVGYQEHISFLIQGLLSDKRNRTPWYSMERGLTDMDKRMNTVEQLYDYVLEPMTFEAEAAPYHM